MVVVSFLALSERSLTAFRARHRVTARRTPVLASLFWQRQYVASCIRTMPCECPTSVSATLVLDGGGHHFSVCKQTLGPLPCTVVHVVAQQCIVARSP